jgi:CPA2 family monovalent cation:H+ antiporter-2
MPLRALAKREREQQATMGLSGHILVIGYGESGEAAVKVLRELGHRPVVLDMGPREVTKAEQCGHPSFIGDARSADILEHVHLSEALGVIVSIPDFGASRVVVGQCKRLAPHVPVIARARYHQFAAELDVAGADIVADEEILVGAALAHRLAAQLPEVKPEPKTEAAS